VVLSFIGWGELTISVWGLLNKAPMGMHISAHVFVATMSHVCNPMSMMPRVVEIMQCHE
jgi:hypothetical protein